MGCLCESTKNKTTESRTNTEMNTKLTTDKSNQQKNNNFNNYKPNNMALKIFLLHMDFPNQIQNQKWHMIKLQFHKTK